MNKGLNYADAAPKLLKNGYEAIPIIPGTKRPPLDKWTDIDFLDPSEVSDFVVKYPKYGVGVKTGELVAIDLDIPDYDLADEFEDVCFSCLGHAPIRFGKTPKRTLFYRLASGQLIKQMTPSYQADGKKYQVEMLGAGQQSVVFGIHPDTQAPYYWVDDSLLDIPLNELTVVTADRLMALKNVFEARLSNKFGNGQSLAHKPDPKPATSAEMPAASSDRVVDALSYLDPQDYDTWIAVGYALKSFGRQDGLSIFQNWSAKRSDGSIPSNYVSHEDVAIQFGKLKPSRTSLNAIFTRASGQGWEGANELFTGIVSHTSVARHILRLLCTDKPKPIFDEGQLWVYAATHWEP
ncbi:bifunctional DNA primase/polymerase [Alphaproteobacteria bacterium]|nr:bifunctional DNA primase/polymerase [Alphaproteobacteria bacterium]